MTIQELYLILQRYNMAQRVQSESPLVVIQTGTDSDGNRETMRLASLSLNIDEGGHTYLVLIPGE